MKNIIFMGKPANINNLKAGNCQTFGTSQMNESTGVTENGIESVKKTLQLQVQPKNSESAKRRSCFQKMIFDDDIK